jgi:all-trans-retinol 13,14-reductase
MSKQRVIIIGSGLGGLTTAVVLAKNGYDVVVLEQGAQVGGCLQCFVRRGAKFETGMHFIGSASPGQTLDKLLRYLEVRQDITLSALDTQGYNVVSLGGQEYRFANGREAFIEQMASYFPHQRDNLVRYYDLIEQVADASQFHSLRYAESDTLLQTEYQLRSINDVMDDIISDPLLAKVLVGALPLYAGERDKTPFATHAFITDFYSQSAYRVVGGSDLIAQSLVQTIGRYGGQVLTSHRATRIVCDDSHATGVEVNGEVFFPADYVISDAHPMRTLELLDSRLIRPAFRQRINSMPQTVGGFTVYLEFHEGRVPYLNSNYFCYEGDDPWNCEHYDDASWPKGFLYMHFCHEVQPRYAQTAVILSYMHMDDVAQWLGTRVGQRGDDYEAFKQQKADRLLAAVERRFPGLRAAVRHCYTSTPLTYLDYTGTEGGSMYGIAHDVTLGPASRVPHRTKVPNVLLTGQNINSHGILGTIVGTIVTCSELLTAQRIYQQIVKANE